MDDKRDEDDAVLANLFEAGKSQTPAPSAAFLARLAADAETAVPRPVTGRATVRTPGAFERFKGWFALSGLSSAAAIGVWIGFIAPDLITAVSPLTDDVTALSAFLPGYDLSALSE